MTTTETKVSEPFHIGMVRQYAEVLSACTREATVGWCSDVTGEVQWGTLRHVYATADQDVRELNVHITTRTGGELEVPFPEVVHSLGRKNARFPYLTISS